MSSPTVAELVPILQTAIGPALLISGVGLLLLTMTNRLGRVVDRARLLVQQLQDSPADLRRRKSAQLPILWQRARQIRLAIAFASTSALLAAVLVVVLFLSALLRIEDAWLISVLFILCMGTLIASLIVFLQDINRSLTALKFELEEGHREAGYNACGRAHESGEAATAKSRLTGDRLLVAVSAGRHTWYFQNWRTKK